MLLLTFSSWTCLDPVKQDYKLHYETFILCSWRRWPLCHPKNNYKITQQTKISYAQGRQLSIRLIPAFQGQRDIPSWYQVSYVNLEASVSGDKGKRGNWISSKAGRRREIRDEEDATDRPCLLTLCFATPLEGHFSQRSVKPTLGFRHGVPLGNQAQISSCHVRMPGRQETTCKDVLSLFVLQSLWDDFLPLTESLIVTIIVWTNNCQISPTKKI